MTDQYGLGAVESPPDPRDWPLALAPVTAPLPRRYVCNGMGPVLNQGQKPQCVAYSSAGLKTWQEKRDAHGVVTFDTDWLYVRCKAIDGIAGPGTTVRAAMRVMKGSGYRPLSEPDELPAHFKIAAYYAAPTTIDGMKAALVQYGPIVVGGRWFNSWFHPVNGIIDAGTGGVAGGHAVLVFGWDDDVAGGSLLVRNSWGLYQGSTNGNFYAPYRHYVHELWEAWKSVDVVGLPG